MDQRETITDNPYQPSVADKSRSIYETKPEDKAPLGIRVFAGIMGLVQILFAFGGYVVWSLANFYFSKPGPQFYVVLLSAICLFLMAVYCGLVAATGYNLISRRRVHLSLGGIFVLSISACVLILLFY